MSALRRLVEEAPPGAQVGITMAREWWLRELDKLAGPAAGPDNYIRLAAAAAVTTQKPGTLRAAAPRWARMADAPIRVRKEGPSPRSPWLFHEGDCFRYRREDGGGPRPVVEGPAAPQLVAEHESGDERGATVDAWAQFAYETTEAACPARSRKGRSRGGAGATRSA